MMTNKTFIENLYNSLLEIFGEECFDVSTLDPKDDLYGENLVNALHDQGLVYIHAKHNNTIDAVSYVNDIELDNHIIIRNIYWTKYGQLCVSKNGGIAGWYKRSSSSGHPITFDISINGDEYQSIISIEVSANGPIGNIIISIKDGTVYYMNNSGEYVDYINYTNVVKNAFSTDRGISNMMLEVISNTVDWIFENIVQVSFDMTGYTQME